MPSRAMMHKDTREDSPPSESEKSFVSAESKTTRSGGKDGQSGASVALRSSSPQRHPQSQRSVAPANLTSPTSLASPTADSVTNSNPFFATTQVSPQSKPLSPTPSYFTPQPGASGLEPRSPQNRRPPASRSSHGIETFSGPPPALSTQRSYTGEAPWRNTPPISSRASYPQSPNATPSIDSIVNLTQTAPHEVFDYNPSVVARDARSIPLSNDGPMATRRRSSGRRDETGDQDSTLRIHGEEWERRKYNKNVVTKESISSNEDLFLNLARADSAVDGEQSRSVSRQRRRSHISNPNIEQRQTPRPSSSGRPSTSGASFGGQSITPHRNHIYKSSLDITSNQSQGEDSLPSLRDLASGSRHYAASAHPLDQRSRFISTRTSFGASSRNSSTLDQSPDANSSYGRRPSLRDASPERKAQNYRQSNLSYTANGLHESSPLPERSSGAVAWPHGEGTESTASTTAPSTVWDELDDLKSRLRKLELTGVLPTSSNAAMSKVQGERPPTASTTMTTMSSSPKRRQADSLSPGVSVMKDAGVANIHPLLHSALAKAKLSLNASLYKALEATAYDALNLAAMTGSAGSDDASQHPASVVGSANATDRRLRRKADSMCRSLTELYIALAEEAPENEAPNVKIRSGSGGTPTTAQQSPTLTTSRFLRDSSNEPEARASSRVMSRLEARRTSLLGSSPSYGQRESTPEDGVPVQAEISLASRLGRTTTVLRRDNTKSESSGDRRSLSRAATETGQMRPSPQTRISREYTSQHPLPNSSDRSPSVQSSLPMRKTYFSSTTQSPVTPNVQPGNRRYLERSTPPSSTDSNRLAQARQRRIASLGQNASANQSRIGLSSGRSRQNQTEP
ncbi:hypothetical protein MMC21_002239 [Puttea exsequens]|nr:hypothetical protein [Puttea exsequens]